MKAVLIDSPGRLTIADIDRPEPREGEVLIKLRCCGICGTDLEKVHGQGITSRVLGHEEVGEVVVTGSGVSGVKVGDRVYAHHHVPCGVCYLCRMGEETLCPEYSKHNLVPCGLSEYFVVPRYNVERGAILSLPDDLSYEKASFIEPLACCIRGLRRANVRSARNFLVYGAGPVGLLHLKLIKNYVKDSSVAVADISDYRVSLASGSGADSAFNISHPSEKDAALKRSFGDGPQVVILATGSSSALEDALSVVSRGGTVLLFGAPRRDATGRIDMARFFLNGTRLITSYAATETETSEALQILSEGSIDVSDMITHRFPLCKAAEAFEVAGKQQCMKALIIN